MTTYPPLPKPADRDRIGDLLDLAERNNRLLVALARDNGLDADGSPVDMAEADGHEVFFTKDGDGYDIREAIAVCKDGGHEPTAFVITDCREIKVSNINAGRFTVRWRRHYRCCDSLSGEREITIVRGAAIKTIKDLERRLDEANDHAHVTASCGYVVDEMPGEPWGYVAAEAGPPSRDDSRQGFFDAIEAERRRQEAKFPGQRIPFFDPAHYDDRGVAFFLGYEEAKAKRRCDVAASSGTCDWNLVLAEEVAEFLHALARGDAKGAYKEGVEVCAVVLRMLESPEFAALKGAK